MPSHQCKNTIALVLFDSPRIPPRPLLPGCGATGRFELTDPAFRFFGSVVRTIFWGLPQKPKNAFRTDDRSLANHTKELYRPKASFHLLLRYIYIYIRIAISAGADEYVLQLRTSLLLYHIMLQSAERNAVPAGGGECVSTSDPEMLGPGDNTSKPMTTPFGTVSAITSSSSVVTLTPTSPKTSACNSISWSPATGFSRELALKTS